MTALRLVALRSDDTLGFLAALGVVELLRASGDGSVKLGWEGISGCAVLEVNLDSVEQLADELLGIARGLRDTGRLTPATDPQLVPRALSTADRRAADKVALDPLKMAVRVAIARFQQVHAAEQDGPDSADAWWMTGLVNQLAAANPRESDVRKLTPLYAASGQMTVHQLLREALDDVLRRPGRVLEALAGWRREPGTGANLDERALVDAVAGPAGAAQNRAVLGASWLALQAIPWFTQVGDGKQGDAVLWTRGPGGSWLTWPVWDTPLDVPAMRTLFRHPLARHVPPPARDAEPAWSVTATHRQQARTLGVAGVLRAGRRTLSKSAGPLRAPEVVWRAG